MKLFILHDNGEIQFLNLDAPQRKYGLSMPHPPRIKPGHERYEELREKAIPLKEALKIMDKYYGVKPLKETDKP